MAKGVFQDSTSTDTVTVNEGLTTEKRVRDICNELISAQSSISIQTVLAEVKGVIYNEDDLENMGINNQFFIGAIKASPLVPFDILPEDGHGWILPINAAVRDYPVIGELVSIINLGAQTFYTAAVNITNSVNQNMKIGITSNPTDGKIKYNQLEAYLKSQEGGFSINPYPRPVKQFPGDWVINGRNDQSIRIGKSESTQRDAVIKIRIAEEEEEPEFLYSPLSENINEDVASIYMLREEEVELKVYPNASGSTPNSFVGPQIMIDSDQLVFNAKEGGNVYMFAGSESHIVAKDNAHMIGQNVLIGDNVDENLQPAVLGDQIVGFLHEVFQQLQSYLNAASSATGVGNLGMAVPIPGHMAAAAGLSSFLEMQTKQEMTNRLLSTNVKVSRRPKQDLQIRDTETEEEDE